MAYGAAPANAAFDELFRGLGPGIAAIGQGLQQRNQGLWAEYHRQKVQAAKDAADQQDADAWLALNPDQAAKLQAAGIDKTHVRYKPMVAAMRAQAPLDRQQAALDKQDHAAQIKDTRDQTQSRQIMDLLARSHPELLGPTGQGTPQVTSPAINPRFVAPRQESEVRAETVGLPPDLPLSGALALLQGDLTSGRQQAGIAATDARADKRYQIEAERISDERFDKELNVVRNAYKGAEDVYSKAASEDEALLRDIDKSDVKPSPAEIENARMAIWKKYLPAAKNRAWLTQQAEQARKDEELRLKQEADARGGSRDVQKDADTQQKLSKEIAFKAVELATKEKAEYDKWKDDKDPEFDMSKATKKHKENLEGAMDGATTAAPAATVAPDTTIPPDKASAFNAAYKSARAAGKSSTEAQAEALKAIGM